MALLAVLFVITVSCATGPLDGDAGDYAGIDFRQEMRNLVIGIADYARESRPGFIVIPQNGQELLTASGDAGGPPASSYLAAIDGIGREDLYYGYTADNRATPAAETAYMEAFLDRAEINGVEVLVTDYCSTESKVADSYARSAARGFVSFAADRRDLDTVPAYPATPYGAHTGTVSDLSEMRNFLYLIDPSGFDSADALVTALAATEYDLLIVDLFDQNGTALTGGQVAALQEKPAGTQRLVLAYLSIGEAETYRFYWDAAVLGGQPDWLVEENPDWPGNYKVEYWDPTWQSILLGSPGSYLDRILAAGFDGVYLDIIDAFEYFEAR